MKAAIITEGGSLIGYGHVSRCTALREAFRSKGVKTDFFVDADKGVERFLGRTGYTRLGWLKDHDAILKAIKGCSIAVIDSYLAPVGFYREVSRHVPLCAYIDDFQRISYPEGIIVNGIARYARLSYPATRGIRIFPDKKYIILRKEFWRVPQKLIRKKMGSLLVTFGGVDQAGLTPFVLELLARRFPALQKHVVVARGFGAVDRIKECADKHTRIYMNPGAGKMLELMHSCDVAVSAGGQTIFELARLGVPSVIICVAANQLNNIRASLRAGSILYAGANTDKAIAARLVELLGRISAYQLRKRMSTKAKAFVDGKGAINIAEQLLRAAYAKKQA